MPSVTVSRSDLFPPATIVGVYPARTRLVGQAPSGAGAIASGTVDAAGSLTVTDPGIVQGTNYALYALVGGEHRYLRVRSTLDVHQRPVASGTFNTANGSAALTAVSPSGSLAVGMRVTGPNIPVGRYVVSGSGTTYTLNDGSGVTASTGSAFAADGAVNPVAVLGNTPRPGQPSTWQAQVRQRRQLAGIN
jgi:hypothetical protein